MNSFTPAERLELFEHIRKIFRNGELRPAHLDYWLVKVALRKLWEKGVPLRNEFGHNKVLVALETMELAAEEIGLRGRVFMAFLIYALADSMERYAFISQQCAKDTKATLKGLMRVSQLEVKQETMNTDNFRNLFVSQAGDMRIVLIMIARCVILMRRIKETPNVEARRRLSTEAAGLYAPLAHKLGLYKLKSELEDLSLKYLEPDAYYHIKEELNATKSARDAYIEKFTAPIREMLDREGIIYHMKGRTKSIHSIWQKMKKQQCGFSNVYDLFAIRIIIKGSDDLKKEKGQCWNIFSLITNRYESNLKRLRDWLTVPKSNGYESLHITVRGPEDKWVEVQIRSERMDEIAEKGLAAHWRYKGIKSGAADIDAWLADIRSVLESGNENLLTESLASKGDKHEIYVFTPKGDLYRMPAGATLLDFAYYIHSEVGNRCVGGRMNGRNIPIRQQLESGTTVEIITSNSQKPKMEWVNIVVSSHAKAKIRTAVHELQAREGTLARELLARKLKNRKLDWDESVVNQLIRKSGFKESSEFYRAIAEGKLGVNALIERYQELTRREAGLAERAAVRSAGEYIMDTEQEMRKQGGEDVLVIDRNLKGLDFQMARCCNPVYGDDVFGFITVGGGIKIHRKNCPNAQALHNRFDYRIVPARWAGKGSGKYSITLHVVGVDDLGVVNNITSIISKEEHVMLRSISIDSDDGLFSGVLTVTLDDVQMLKNLIKKITAVRGVKAVSRT